MPLDFDSARLPNPDLRPHHEQWRTQLRRFIDKEIRRDLAARQYRL